ncbi:MAG: hypothetical protein U0231_00235 [Nitrospiraceae bacterium]
MISTVIVLLPASRLFSINSLTTAAGRSGDLSGGDTADDVVG